MCPSYPRPKSVGQILMEAVIECARRNPELWLTPRLSAEDRMDWLDWVGA